LDLRERIIFLFAVLVGMRPGEIFALRWSRVAPDMVNIMERVYRGLPSDPKSERGKRWLGFPLIWQVILSNGVMLPST